MALIGLLYYCKKEHSTDLNSGLVAYYPFNGNAVDATKNGYNGTVIGATLTSDRFGNRNSAYLLNGVDNYISINDAPALKLTNELSLIAWIKTNICIDCK